MRCSSPKPVAASKGRLLAYLPACLLAYLPTCLLAYLPACLYLLAYVLAYLPTCLLASLRIGALLFSEPLAAGALAGVLAILASQPADVVLTRTNDEGATLGGSIAQVAAAPASILNGLGPRLLFGVLLTSAQFLLYTQRPRPFIGPSHLPPTLTTYHHLHLLLTTYRYTQLRGALGVSKADFVLVWDVLADLRS